VIFMKVSVSLNVNPESDQETKDNPNSYQSISYTLNGFDPKISLSDLNDVIYNWLKEQTKKK